jgi:hypothetical protein
MKTLAHYAFISMLVIVLMIITPESVLAWARGKLPTTPQPEAPVTPVTSVTEQEVSFLPGTGWCEEGCITLQEWEVLVTDDQIFVALTIAYHYYPEWRELAQSAVLSQTRVVWEEMDEHILGYYSSRDNTIYLNTLLKAESYTIIAGVIFHETAHAAFAARQTYEDTPAGCLEEEMEAFRWEAEGFARIRQGTEDTELGRYMNNLVVLRKLHQLQSHVLLMDGYQEQCLGRVLPDY